MCFDFEPRGGGRGVERGGGDDWGSKRELPNSEGFFKEEDGGGGVEADSTRGGILSFCGHTEHGIDLEGVCVAVVGGGEGSGGAGGSFRAGRGGVCAVQLRDLFGSD